MNRNLMFFKKINNPLVSNPFKLGKYRQINTSRVITFRGKILISIQKCFKAKEIFIITLLIIMTITSQKHK